MKKINSPRPLIMAISNFRHFAVAGAIAFSLISCSSDSEKKADSPGSESAAAAAPSDKGIGPVSTVTLGAIEETLASSGKAVFESKCTACHKIETKVVGPALAGVTKRRKPEWIMNMILNPTEMTQKDPVARELLATYIAPMANQNLTQEDARAVLEFFRQNDSK